MKMWFPVWIVCWSTLSAQGAIFSIANRTSDLAANDPIYLALVAQCDAIESTVNNGFLSATSRQTLVDGIALTHQGSEVGLLIDRATKPGPVDVGFGTSLGLMTSASFTNLSTSLAANTMPSVPGVLGASFVFGTNFSSLGAFKKNLLRTVDKRVVRGEKFMLFVRGMYLNGTSVGAASAKMMQLGANGRYRLMDPHFMGMGFTWNGLNFGTGLNYSSYEMGYTATVNQTSSGDVSGETATVIVNVPFQLATKSTLITIPIELSSSLTFLYFFTFYAGGGADIAFGSSSLTGTASVNTVASYTGPVFVGNLFSGASTINMDDGTVGKPSTFVARAFGGVQFNFYFAKLGVEYNLLTNGTQALSAFFRFAVAS